MNIAHIHLLLNHFPIIGALFGLGFLGFGLLERNETLTTAAKVVIALVAAASIPTFLTGEPAEKQIEGLAGISKKLIHAHEEAALLGLVVMLVAGAVALFLLFKHRQHRGLHIGLLVIVCGAFGLMVRAGNLGGEIQHQEIRDVSSSPLTSARSDIESRQG